MKFKDCRQVEVQHQDGTWWPGSILELTFEAGKKYVTHDALDNTFKVTIPEDLYLVEAAFPTGKLHKVQRLARDIRKPQLEAVAA